MQLASGCGSECHAALSGIACDITDNRGRNTATSVRDRLLELARQRGEDFQLILTRDVDFLGRGDSGKAALQEIFRNLCNVPVEDDGLVFLTDSARVELIRDATEYGEIRVTLLGDPGGSRGFRLK